MIVGTERLSELVFPFDSFQFTRPTETTRYVKLINGYEFRVGDLKLAATGAISPISPTTAVTVTGLTATSASLTSPTFPAPSALVGNGGVWYKLLDPGLDWFASKTSGWTADSFTTGYLELNFTNIVPTGTQAVYVMMQSNTVNGAVYWKAEGDTNISDTPFTAKEYAHAVNMPTNTQSLMMVIPINTSTLKARITVSNTSQDVYFSYPSHVLIGG